jgi:hypothetical protein
VGAGGARLARGRGRDPQDGRVCAVPLAEAGHERRLEGGVLVADLFQDGRDGALEDDHLVASPMQPPRAGQARQVRPHHADPHENGVCTS